MRCRLPIRSRIQRFYAISYHEGELLAVRNEDKMKEALSLCGDYVLKTDKALGAPNCGSFV